MCTSSDTHFVGGVAVAIQPETTDLMSIRVSAVTIRQETTDIIVNTESKRSFRMFPRWSSFLEVKRILASVHHFDFFMFVERRNNVYQELGTAHDIPVDHVLKDGDTIYLSKNDFFRSYCRLYFNGSEVGNFGFGGESVLSIKLRSTK